MTTLIIADVHANAAALTAVLDAEANVDQIIFLGDAVDVGPNPDRVLSSLRSAVDFRVVGNHDRSVLDVDPDAETDDEYEQWKQWTRSRMTDRNLEFLESAPRTTIATVGDRRFRLHHGDFEPPDTRTEWSTRSTPNEAPAMFKTVANRYDEAYVLHGHSHRPFVAEVDGTTFLNPGSVGLQRADMRSDVARYAVFDGTEFYLRSIAYDVADVRAACDDLPLPQEFLASWKRKYRRTEND